MKVGIANDGGGLGALAVVVADEAAAVENGRGCPAADVFRLLLPPLRGATPAATREVFAEDAPLPLLALAAPGCCFRRARELTVSSRMLV
jgi:hypothetical protein